MRSLILTTVLAVATPLATTASFADTPNIGQIDHVLELAKQDAEKLVATGAVCEHVGVMNSSRDIQCGVTGIRADIRGMVWTTKCYILCQSGFFEEGNLCKFPAKDQVTLSEGFCNR